MPNLIPLPQPTALKPENKRQTNAVIPQHKAVWHMLVFALRDLNTTIEQLYWIDPEKKGPM